MMDELLSQLAHLCQVIGRDPLLIQGAGGNISAKSADGGTIYIKASGFRLKEVTETAGLAAVDQKKFLSALETIASLEDSAKESGYSTAIATSTLPGNSLRPSMELGFHSLIPHRWVAHTHSLAGQLAQSRPDVRRRLERELPEVQFVDVPFRLPGWELSWVFKQICAEQGVKASRPVCFFLANHGLVLGASTSEEALKVTERLETLLRQEVSVTGDSWKKWFKEVGEPLPEKIVFSGSASLRERLSQEFLFPDLAIFVKPGDLVGASNGDVELPTKDRNLAKLRDTIENIAAALLLLEKKKPGTGQDAQAIGQQLRALPTEVARMKEGKTK